ncbi:MAG: flagellar M-ring protein FliF [Bryobacterales bacterium]|nr:flagellar M-ring protein FliF [Bryobacterales bacterium]
MAQIRKLLGSFSAGQLTSIVLVVAAAGAGLFYLVRWKRESDFRPLYSGMEAEDAAAVVERLKQSGAEYRISPDGGTVLAPSARVAELRLSLAAAGLPRNGRIGFELFDRTNFGATEFAEQVNFRRALEGELERSVVSLAAVEQARVHLAFPKDSVFLEARQPAKASVMVKLKPGARLAPQNVVAISHLVASAVQGLGPEAVSVLDVQGNLLNRPRRAEGPESDAPSEATLEFRQALERDLVQKISTTLEPLVGADKFRVSAAVECDFTSGEQSEENFDPARSVMLTSQKTEETTGANTQSGVPGTASNLPRPTSQATVTLGAGGVSRMTESITYQSSRSVKRVKLPQGAVRRISLAVLLDHERRWVAEGATRRAVAEPPPPERLKAVRDLVSAAAGLNTERGDQLIVESLPFETPLASEPMEGPPPAAPAPRTPLPPWLERIGGVKTLMGAGGAVGLLLLASGFLLWKGRRRKRVATVVAQLPGAKPAAAAVTGGAEAASIQEASETYPELPAPPPRKSEIVAGRLKETIKKDPASSAQILRSWLTDEEE